MHDQDEMGGLAVMGSFILFFGGAFLFFGAVMVLMFGGVVHAFGKACLAAGEGKFLRAGVWLCLSVWIASVLNIWFNEGDWWDGWIYAGILYTAAAAMVVKLVMKVWAWCETPATSPRGGPALLTAPGAEPEDEFTIQINIRVE